MKNHIRKVLVVESENDLSELVSLEMKVAYPLAVVESMDLNDFTIENIQIEGNSQLPSMILVNLSGSDSTIAAVIKELKLNSISSHIPVICFTDASDGVAGEMFYQSKVNCQLRMPDKKEELQTILKAILHLWVPKPGVL